MNARITGIALFGAVVTMAATPALEEFKAEMGGSFERPKTVSTLAKGTAELRFDGSGPISYSVRVSNLTGPASGAHIHGPADTSGAAGVLVDLKIMKDTVDGSITNGTINAADVRMISLDSLKALIRNGRAYVNVHTKKNPDGEIRGQVRKK